MGRWVATTILFNALPCLGRRFIELVLYLLQAIAPRHQHTCNDEWIRFLPTFFKFLARFLLQFGIPWFARGLIGPMKVLGGPENFSIEREGFFAAHVVGDVLHRLHRSRDP